MNKLKGPILIIVAVIFSVAFLIISARRDLSNLENVLFQILCLSCGLYGSYIFGQDKSREKALDIIKLPARSAFRRLVSLYKSLSRLAQSVENEKNECDSNNKIKVSTLDKIEVLLIEQIATADDALEDWKDIIPEELENLKLKIRESRA